MSAQALCEGCLVGLCHLHSNFQSLEQPQEQISLYETSLQPEVQSVRGPASKDMQQLYLQDPIVQMFGSDMDESIQSQQLLSAVADDGISAGIIPTAAQYDPTLSHSQISLFAPSHHISSSPYDNGPLEGYPEWIFQNSEQLSMLPRQQAPTTQQQYESSPYSNGPDSINTPFQNVGFVPQTQQPMFSDSVPSPVPQSMRAVGGPYQESPLGDHPNSAPVNQLLPSTVGPINVDSAAAHDELQHNHQQPSQNTGPLKNRAKRRGLTFVKKSNNRPVYSFLTEKDPHDRIGNVGKTRREETARAHARQPKSLSREEILGRYQAPPQGLSSVKAASGSRRVKRVRSEPEFRQDDMGSTHAREPQGSQVSHNWQHVSSTAQATRTHEPGALLMHRRNHTAPPTGIAGPSGCTSGVAAGFEHLNLFEGIPQLSKPWDGAGFNFVPTDLLQDSLGNPFEPQDLSELGEALRIPNGSQNGGETSALDANNMDDLWHQRSELSPGFKDPNREPEEGSGSA